MVTFQGVSFAYDRDVPVLDGISFSVEDGEFVAIVGENGAGKTTLMKLFDGLLKPTEGDVLVDGDNTKLIKTSLLARKIGFLFQNPDRQICKNTVLDELLFSLACVGRAGDEAVQEAKRVLDAFGLDGARRPYLLSRGERQRVALASVVATEPQMLILDEPTTGLDYRECTGIMEIVGKLHKKGTTVVMVSHDMELVADYAERVIVLAGGKIAADGACREVLSNPDITGQSAILPPQIFELARRLGSGFEGICTYREMADAIERYARADV